MASLKQLQAMSKQAATNGEGQKAQEIAIFIQAITAMGCGSIEERLLRLMAWLGGLLQSKRDHSGLFHPLEVVASREAWCDQQCRAFRYFAWRVLGVDGKDLVLIHSNGKQRHTVAELLYDGGWHLFDAHADHMSVYRHPQDGHIMSHEELCAMPEVVKNQQHWWETDGIGKEGFYVAPAKHFSLSSEYIYSVDESSIERMAEDKGSRSWLQDVLQV